MATYILDTNIISYLWDSKSIFHDQIKNKLYSLNNDDIVATTIISIYELTYGIDSFKNDKLKKYFLNAIESIKNDKDISIYPLDLESASYFSNVKNIYKKDTGIIDKSIKKNDLDFMIASIALSQNAILVSNDKLFKVLAENTDLQYENWIEE